VIGREGLVGDQIENQRRKRTVSAIPVWQSVLADLFGTAVSLFEPATFGWMFLQGQMSYNVLQFHWII
jgi:hypothetical protein